MLFRSAAMEPLRDAIVPDCEAKPALLQETIVRPPFSRLLHSAHRYQLGSFLILAALSQKNHLTTKAVKSLLTTVAGCADLVTPKQLVRTLVTICAPQVVLEKLPNSVVKTLTGLPCVPMFTYF